jgi:hypothetical protein
MTYDIGYRRPPAASRFKKGKSGNPKGRPKGSRNIATLIEQELQKRVVITENGKKRTVTRAQALAMKLVSEAMKGDAKCLTVMLDLQRRFGGSEAVDGPNLLPPDHEEILANYVRQYQLPPPTEVAAAVAASVPASVAPSPIEPASSASLGPRPIAILKKS